MSAQSAPVSSLYPCNQQQSSTTASSEIWLNVNGERRQSGRLDQMIWSVPEVVSVLSHQFRLVPGDLILTGTPSGVGPLEVGDVVTGGIEGLGEIAFRIVER